MPAFPATMAKSMFLLSPASLSEAAKSLNTVVPTGENFKRKKKHYQFIVCYRSS